ncbi:hypothetical protein LPJ53_005707 [Coemansia erecta]|uniref:RRM domain-containing protein n=1 Tax=Coemansia erecta TaxID=147472 RepID=A0A9W7XWY3_9FUNG|nr:hypothetical protein LPJ53_005707 [Coemansia erecta]
MKKGQFSRRLFVTGFPKFVKHGELTSRFEEFGTIISTRMVLGSPGTDEFPYAFIEFQTSTDATLARNGMMNAAIRGYQLEVHFDSRIPLSIKPSNMPREFHEAAFSPIHAVPPPPPPMHMRRGSNEGSIHSSHSQVISPQPSPDYNRDARASIPRGPPPPPPHPSQLYSQDRHGDFDSHGQHPPVSPHMQDGHYTQDRRRNTDRSGAPVRNRSYSKFPGGNKPYSRSGPSPYSNRYERQPYGGPRYAHSGRPSYGRSSNNNHHHHPGSHHRHSNGDGHSRQRQHDRRQYDDQQGRSPDMDRSGGVTPLYDEGDYTPRNHRDRSDSPTQRRRLMDEDEYDRHLNDTFDDEVIPERDNYSAVTPRQSRSPEHAPDMDRSDSQVSLGLYKGGGHWSTKVSPRGKTFDDSEEGLLIAPEIRPRSGSA